MVPGVPIAAVTNLKPTIQVLLAAEAALIRPLQANSG